LSCSPDEVAVVAAAAAVDYPQPSYQLGAVAPTSASWHLGRATGLLAPFGCSAKTAHNENRLSLSMDDFA